MPASSRPASSRTAAATNATMSQRRVVMSDANALSAQPPFHLALNRRQPVGAQRFVARDDHRLGIRGADEPPAVAEQYADTVDVDHVMTGAEELHRALDEAELELFRHIDSNFRRGDIVGDVGEKLFHGATGIGQDAQEARGAV